MKGLPSRPEPVDAQLSGSAAFERAFRRHAREVQAAAQGVLGDPARAHDVVQEVFLRLWRRPDRFDAGRGDLGTYLRLMGRSRALDLLREGQARQRATDRLERAAERRPEPIDSRPDAELERRRAAAVVRAGLQELPGPQREALVGLLVRADLRRDRRAGGRAPGDGQEPGASGPGQAARPVRRRARRGLTGARVASRP